MKLRFLKLFILCFIVIFTVLNGRFGYANLRYWLSDGSAAPLPEGRVARLPLSPSRTLPVLPGQGLLKIDRLGIAAPIVFGAGNDLKVLYQNLEQGVVHYSDSPKPGEKGTSVILGHSSAYPWYKGAYGSGFALLGKLQVGDAFYVEYADGQRFNYVVKQSIIFKPLTEDPRLV